LEGTLVNQEIWNRFEKLWVGDDYDARERFAKKEDLPRDLILEILSGEGDLGILCALGANPKLPADIAWGMFNYDYAITIEEDSELMVHRGLAENKSVPKELLHELANSENEEISEIAIETLGSF